MNPDWPDLDQVVQGKCNKHPLVRQSDKGILQMRNIENRYNMAFASIGI
jgi:hypothetical protein